MVVMCLNKNRETPGEQPEAALFELTVRIAPAASAPLWACSCGQALRAFQPVLLPLKHLAYRHNSLIKHCDENAACGQCLSGFLGL